MLLLTSLLLCLLSVDRLSVCLFVCLFDAAVCLFVLLCELSALASALIWFCETMIIDIRMDSEDDKEDASSVFFLVDVPMFR